MYGSAKMGATHRQSLSARKLRITGQQTPRMISGWWLLPSLVIGVFLWWRILSVIC